MSKTVVIRAEDMNLHALNTAKSFSEYCDLIIEEAKKNNRANSPTPNLSKKKTKKDAITW